jgi:hypothetical protein
MSENGYFQRAARQPNTGFPILTPPRNSMRRMESEQNKKFALEGLTSSTGSIEAEPLPQYSIAPEPGRLMPDLSTATTSVDSNQSKFDQLPQTDTKISSTTLDRIPSANPIRGQLYETPTARPAQILEPTSIPHEKGLAQYLDLPGLPPNGVRKSFLESMPEPRIDRVISQQSGDHSWESLNSPKSNQVDEQNVQDAPRAIRSKTAATRETEIPASTQAFENVFHGDTLLAESSSKVDSGEAIAQGISTSAIPKPRTADTADLKVSIGTVEIIVNSPNPAIIPEGHADSSFSRLSLDRGVSCIFGLRQG